MSFPNPSILIIEDNPDLQNGLKIIFEQSDYKVKTATDPIQAEKILNKFYPDIILLDIFLPQKDGFQFLAEIKNRPKLSSIPVVVISNLDQAKDQQTAIRLGANAYFVKNHISLNQIVTQITNILSGN